MTDSSEPRPEPADPYADPHADPADAPTSTYRPPTNGYASYSQPSHVGSGWPAEPTWPQQTPERWLEPLPAGAPVTRVARAQRRGGGIGFAVALIVVAVLAATLSSAGTLFVLLSGGWLSSGAAVLAPTATPGAPSSTDTPLVVPVDDLVSRAAAAVGPAVVTITTTTDSTDPFTLPETGVGSGVIYDSAGWIVTNRHVVGSAETVQVELPDGRKFTGDVYGIDTLTDLAIVKIEGSDLPAARVGDSSTLKPGQLAVAIGSPLGTFTNSVTSGVISALGRDVPVTDPVSGAQRILHNLVQTDAAINPGNSGGPLIDAAGTVIGINTAVAGNAQGIGFAIPVNIAKPIMEQATNGQPLQRPWMGVYYVPVNRSVAETEGLPIDYGAYVSAPTSGEPAVQPGTPAEAAGVQDGDIITAIDGRRIDGENPLDDVLSQYRPGDTVTLTVLRDGQTVQLPLTLGVRPGTTP
jgi:S1-C subfamily serine protease